MLRLTIVLGMAALAVGGYCQVTPFSVCAHLGGGEEYQDHQRELQLLQQAGIRSARADFTWGYFEPQKGQWQFEVYDQIVADSKAHGVTLLPILCYNVDWAFPVQDHLDDWCEYVRTVVTRYKGDLKHWEVWNEPNIEFWKPKPNADEYTRLLKATYDTIKQIDPALQVVYGGTAGVPLDFLRRSFELDGVKAFDVLAVHPYRYPTAPEDGGIAEDLAKVRQLLTEFGGKQPIWITEFGWPTHINPAVGDGSFFAQMIAYAAKQRFPGAASFRAAVLDVPGAPGFGPLTGTVRDGLRKMPGFSVRVVGLADLAGLDPADTPVLVMPSAEQYPADYFDQIVRFVREGGLLVHIGGVPLYYAARLKDGKWEAPNAPEEARASLHVGWKAWWTEKGLPESAGRSMLAVPADSGIVLPQRLGSSRWLTDTKLAGKDRYIPLVNSYKGDALVGSPVALYLYDSDLKGAFLTICLDTSLSGVTDDTEALYLPRAYLIALRGGMSNVYWYEFRDGGDDPAYNEDRFGIIHHDMTPKPAYLAYEAMTAALGKAKFVGDVAVERGVHCCLFDTGVTKTAALWHPGGEVKVTLKVSGTEIRALDYLGKPLDLQVRGGKITVPASEGVVYLTRLKEANGAE